MEITPVESKWIQENIEKIDFLNFLQPQQILALIKHLQPRLLVGNQPVIREGQTGNSFFFIYNGRVSVSITRKGNRTKLATLKRGEYFGEISLLTGKPTTANVIASAPTKVFFLDSGQFLTMVRSNKKFSDHIVSVMKHRLAEREKAIEAMQYGNLDEVNQAITEFLKPKDQ